MWNEVSRLVRLLNKLNAAEDGQGLVEYALILSLVSLATIVILGVLGADVGGVFSNLTSAL